MEFGSTMNNLCAKKVVVDPNSVNCVALDQDPFAPSKQFLISADVTVIHNSNQLRLR